jgi:hypothetical protein
MYKRYIGHGNTVNEALMFCKINRLAFTKKIKKHDITSRTTIILMDTINNETASNMEKILLFAYFYSIKKDDDLGASEYKYYKKLLISFGKEKLTRIFTNFSSSSSCVGIKQDDKKFRIIYFTK